MNGQAWGNEPCTEVVWRIPYICIKMTGEVSVHDIDEEKSTERRPGFYPEIFDRAAQSAQNITSTSCGSTLRARRVVRRKYDLITV